MSHDAPVGPPPGVGGPPPGVGGPPPGVGDPPAAPVRTSLDPAEQAVAEAMSAFAERAREQVLARVAELDGGLQIEERVVDREEARHVVEVTRGPVVEKAGWYVNEPRTGMPPFVPDPVWGRYVEIDVHPASPHVGLLHATVYCSFFTNGTSTMSGYLDYVPAVWHDDDNARLAASVEEVYARHGVDISRFRAELGDSDFGRTHHRERLRAACVGVSLYSFPMLEATMETLALAVDGFDAFVGTYFDILAERRDEPFGPAQVAEQDAMRRRWLEDQLFADTFSMKVVPYEVWSFANQAPTVRF